MDDKEAQDVHGGIQGQGGLGGDSRRRHECGTGEAVEGLPEVFADGRSRHEKDEEEHQARLYQQIGQLQFELDWLKKKSGQVP
jgi:hypothetical protein